MNATATTTKDIDMITLPARPAAPPTDPWTGDREADRIAARERSARADGWAPARPEHDDDYVAALKLAMEAR